MRMRLNIVAGESRHLSHEETQTKTFETAVFTVRMQRLPLFYVTNLILPCSLITFLAVVAFVLPPDEGDKVGFSK